jgi:predicted glycogen debranching enzyme
MSEPREGSTRTPPPPAAAREEERPLSAHQRALGSGAVPVPPPPAKRTRPAAFDPVQIRVPEEECRDLARAAKKEWLLANGVGGYAMSTIVGLNTRREHGLLVAALNEPIGRAVVLAKMEETVQVPGASRALDTTYYPGVVHPRGFELCAAFSLYPFPTFVFAGRRWRIEKRVALVHGENTVVVTYRFLPPRPARRGQPTLAEAAADGEEGRAPLDRVTLRVRPLFAFRGQRDLAEANERIQKSCGIRPLPNGGAVVRCTPYTEWDPVYLVCPDAGFVEAADWYKRVEYPQDRYRGLEFSEDLWSYGYYEAEIELGQTLTVTTTLHPPETHASHWSEAREVERLVQVMSRASDETPFARRLALAADQFVVRRQRDIPAVVAGYPFLADHVRDTLVALTGLTLVTGRFRDAKAILRAHARALERGLLPKRFPDGSTRPEYGSVDASLWFFIAIFKYLQYTGDFDFVRTEMRIPMLETMRYFEEGTRFGIRVDRDGLLTCGEPGLALTWMDARVGNHPINRRAGKPVEVNALWYNALKVMERLAERFSIPNDMARFARRAEQVEAHFLDAFWNPSTGCLNDVVDVQGSDEAIRPNQILAVALPFPLLDSESAESVVRVVIERLLTPLGLRTLDPGHPEYRGSYEGGEEDRQRASYQGTSWTWLLGPCISALVKARGGPGREQAVRLLEPVQRHLQDDGLGQLSELSWGNPPHWPRGCIAHAAAVGEVLRAYHEDILGRNPGTRPGLSSPSLRKR